MRCKAKIQKPVRKRTVKIKKGTPKIECTFYWNWRVLVPFHLHPNLRQNKLAPNLHQRQIFCKRKTPKTVVVSGFFDNCRKAEIISLSLIGSVYYCVLVCHNIKNHSDYLAFYPLSSGVLPIVLRQICDKIRYDKITFCFEKRVLKRYI